MPPLNLIPEQMGAWNLSQEGLVEKEALAILDPDDYLVRDYKKAGSDQVANVFIAYFKSQRTERMPHSPKNCLPGNGWVPYSYRTLSIPVDSQKEPVNVNSYLVRKGDQKSIVLYWYQTWNRTIPNEYVARAYLALDSIRYKRTDTALVRIMVPLAEEAAQTDYQAAAVDFLRAIYPQLEPYFPKS